MGGDGWVFEMSAPGSGSCLGCGCSILFYRIDQLPIARGIVRRWVVLSNQVQSKLPSRFGAVVGWERMGTEERKRLRDRYRRAEGEEWNGDENKRRAMSVSEDELPAGN